ncbi:unnamed protein product [Withania somnifera]
MSLISPTLLIFLFLIFGTGSTVLASKYGVPCLTYLGPCGSKTCDQDCCTSRCIDTFHDKHPSPVCEILPGNPGRLCNCYHDCN